MTTITKYKRGIRTITLNGIEYIPVRTRTGTEVHLGRGSSTVCGRWLKADASKFYVDQMATCQKCLPK